MRHALTIARTRGYAEVELTTGDGSFSAKLGPVPPSVRAKMIEESSHAEPQTADIKATLVGYYRESKDPLIVGKTVKKGDVVGIIAALGIANDLESKVSGEVVEVLVSPGDPVQFGQPVARVRLP